MWLLHFIITNEGRNMQKVCVSVCVCVCVCVCEGVGG